MGTWTAQYDTLNRLLTDTASSGSYNGQKLCWAYDSFGNRTAQTLQAGACPTPETSVPSTAHYNAQNQVTWVQNSAPNGFAYDGAGDVTADAQNYYLYDAEGRICAVASPELPGIQGAWVLTGYLYEADGTRVTKGTITQWSCDPTVSGFQTSQDSILGPGPGTEQMTEVDKSGASMVWEHTNVWAAGRLIATYDTSGNSTDGSFSNVGLHFYLNDPVGTRRTQTDYAGVREQTCQSLPYGDALSCSGTAQDPTAHHFTGKERDTESGNDYFGARYYASTMGRFMSPDPLLNSGRPENPQSWNRYSYGFNNPLRNFDPTGLYTCSGDKKQCSGFADALKAAQAARNSFKKGSAEYNAINSAINAYGKAGVDNGVHVEFGATAGAGNTTVGVLADANGNKITTANNPTGQNINVTLDPSKNTSVDQEAINAAHEGSHVADGTALVGALPMDLAGSDAVLGGPLNMTSYQTEMKAYGVSSYTAQGLGLGSLSVGGNVIWNSSWGAVDQQTLRTQGIQHVLADPKGLYNVTPDNQGHKLIQ